MRLAWVRHRGTPRGVAHLLDVDTWCSPCGLNWNADTHRLHWTYYEPVPVSEPVNLDRITGMPGDNACSRCIERSWRQAVAAELEIVILVNTQPPLPMALEA